MVFLRSETPATLFVSPRAGSLTLCWLMVFVHTGALTTVIVLVRARMLTPCWLIVLGRARPLAAIWLLSFLVALCDNYCGCTLRCLVVGALLPGLGSFDIPRIDILREPVAVSQEIVLLPKPRLNRQKPLSSLLRSSLAVAGCRHVDRRKNLESPGCWVVLCRGG